jgi:hypothetical protein
MLPDFIIIGAMKCGTTSLYTYLDGHPDIAMSRVKEPNYFGKPQEKSLSWYKSLFPHRDGVVLGEASTFYTMHPFRQGVPERIYERIPSVKLIYLVRDPVERILSHYAHNRAHNEELRSLSECLSMKERNGYVAYSSYALQMKQYTPYFSDDQILVVESEKLRSERQATLRCICNFIGVDPDGIGETEIQKEANQSEKQTELVGVTRNLARIQNVRRVYTALPASVRNFLKPLYRSRVQKPELTEEQETELYEYFRPEVEWLRQYTGQEFDSWKI